ncbi:MAG: aspartate/glutamate racemase family protein, partial [Gammaproteobacteria bacterium]|nr:aspartate/glutamate racemase family protein [Gammaproteobacteria bacterium]
STIPYYREINTQVQLRLGGLHSAKILLASVDFAEVELLQRQGDWQAAGMLLAQQALSLQSAGADGIVLCTNTMHKVVPAIEAAIDIPLLHIADATAEQIQAHGMQRVALLGTRFTMEQDFYKQRLQDRYQLQVLTPDEDDRRLVHDIIYQQLCHGIIREDSRQAYQRIMQQLVVRGAQAIILGCTEISLLVSAKDAQVMLFDTTQIHAQAAAQWALAN